MLIIRQARVLDPANGRDEIADIFIKDGVIVDADADFDGAEIIDGAGLVAAPGLVDIHVHFRDPGFTYKEDILTGAAAAAAGGVTTAVCMPNTKPVIDTPDGVQYVAKAAKDAPIRVLTYGAVTLGQLGETLTDAETLKSAGAVALSDDGNPIMSAAVLREALLRARELGLVISSHSEDAEMVRNHAVNEGAVSRRLGIPGRPAIAEEIMIARDAMLAAETGAHVHIAHVSTAKSVEIIRRAKSDGVRITAETCPQYFTITETEVERLGTAARVNPPLRTEIDVRGIIDGLRDGTLDAIATDHAPHSAEEKARSLIDAPSGMIGLETSLALTLDRLYHTGELTLAEIVAAMSQRPADILGIDGGTLTVGTRADIVLFDPDEIWRVDASAFRSKSRNTPFDGRELRGRVKYTIAEGQVVYADQDA